MTALRPSRPRQALAALALVLATAAGHAAGLDIHADADAKDVGLPIYPGAVKRAGPGSDSHSGAFSFGIWGDSFGFKLAVASYRSNDDVEAVARFYRDALAQYGTVLDCTGVHGKARRHDDTDDRDKPVTCDGDSVEPGGHLFKVGINRAQRVFQVKPAGDGAAFTLVRIEMHGTD
jgi:hypothetical protein